MNAVAPLIDYIERVVPLQCSIEPVLAVGAWFKNTLCVTSRNHAFISKAIGDLDTADACLTHEQVARELLDWMDEKPVAIAHDLHPDFFSSRFAAQLAAELEVPLIAVQHHHAHIAAICAEHHIAEPVLGLALDGVGLGTDGTPWGGELLHVRGASFKRMGHLSPLRLPGGDRAAREPWRMAAAALFQMGRGEEIVQRFPNQPGAGTVVTMLQRGLNCPATSSMGRLFDAAAGLLGVCKVQSFEAQAAIELQNLAEQHGMVEAPAAGYGISATGELDFSPLLAALADCSDVAYGAALFHATLAAGLADWVCGASGKHKINHVALGGGCFHNAILLQSLTDKLTAHGLRVLTAQKLQPNDSAISLGQAWVATQSFHQGF